MTLPIITRYVKIEEPSSDGGDAYASVTYSTVEAFARAHISAPSSQNAGDRWQSTDAVLYVDDTTTVPAATNPITGMPSINGATSTVPALSPGATMLP